MVGYEVRDNFLYVNGVQVEWRESPNHGGIITPRLIVIHYTGDNSCEGALSWLCYKNPDRTKRVSAHLVIDKDGTIYQLVPFNLQAWHAGKSSYNGENYANGFSIGIENVGIGDYFPPEQMEANRAVIEVLYTAYPIEDVVGHEDVAPGRKPDPGPHYPWDKVTS